MPRAFTPKIVTANALVEGDVIYLTSKDEWSRRHGDAEFITDEVRANTRLAFAEAQQGYVVGAYLAEAAMGDNGPVPTHFRDGFRARGPSNYDHGKQTELSDV
ncbi:DUF2849 domain-containing protein [Aliiroseovarius sp. YM-037]|uniref:DUF2849 domain-containing protein n=1 Tax=Aliiroseovarius sp. YM-037 TaxID=3341728 RepID=UPI003A7FFF3A